MAWTISDAEPGIHGSAAGSIATDPITDIEWTGAKLTPPCIVEDYLFADVG
jgi:hypothetical protein